MDRDSYTMAAEARDTQPGHLVSLLRGDLDSITMRALEKDRTRRYPAASELAADIQRYLNHEPVLARPASGIPGCVSSLVAWLRHGHDAFALAMQPGKESEALEHLDLAVSAVPKATVLSAQIHPSRELLMRHVKAA
jgi:hypothetical protein